MTSGWRRRSELALQGAEALPQGAVAVPAGAQDDEWGIAKGWRIPLGGLEVAPGKLVAAPGAASSRRRQHAPARRVGREAGDGSTR